MIRGNKTVGLTTVIILLSISLLIFLGCKKDYIKTEDSAIYEELVDEMNRFGRDIEETIPIIQTFIEDSNQRIFELEEQINDLEQRIKALEEN